MHFFGFLSLCAFSSLFKLNLAALSALKNFKSVVVTTHDFEPGFIQCVNNWMTIEELTVHQEGGIVGTDEFCLSLPSFHQLQRLTLGPWLVNQFFFDSLSQLSPTLRVLDKHDLT